MAVWLVAALCLAPTDVSRPRQKPNGRTNDQDTTQKQLTTPIRPPMRRGWRSFAMTFATVVDADAVLLSPSTTFVWKSFLCNSRVAHNRLMEHYFCSYHHFALKHFRDHGLYECQVWSGSTQWFSGKMVTHVDGHPPFICTDYSTSDFTSFELYLTRVSTRSAYLKFSVRKALLCVMNT
jgi:hypothetical protein